MDAPLNQAKLPSLILASASPRRAELLRQMRVPFAVVRAAMPEVAPEHLSPVETAEINAYRKARATAKQHPDSLVLGADTIVCLGTEIFGKPVDAADAERMLARLQGRTHLARIARSFSPSAPRSLSASCTSARSVAIWRRFSRSTKPGATPSRRKAT
jgi:hypothetical protein